MKTIRKRILIIYFVIIFSFSILIFRLGYLKIVHGDEYYERALDLWTRTAPIEGRRGNIYDRNGKIIVGSQLAPTVVVIPKQIINPQETAKVLSEILNANYENILKHLITNVSVEIIKPEGKKISFEQALAIAKENIKGVYIVADSIRSYPYQHYLSHVVGITGIDNQGITGLEYIYDEYLQGKKGGIQIYTDAHGELINQMNSYYNQPTSGFDLYLTVDIDIQVTLERVLDNAMAQYDAEKIIALVMQPQNGEILAMASRPTFNPEYYQQYDPEIYNQNLPIWYSFEPGSTFKIVTFSAGLEEKVFKLDEKFFDPGYMIVDGARIKDWKAGGHGEETFLEVLQNSCNPGFMTIGFRLGKEKLFSYIKKYGFGEKTGIDLLGESSGIIFNINNVNNVELATSSFGQGNSTTAIQLVTAASAAVNGGYLYQPTILKGIKSGYTNEIIYQTTPIIKRQVISKQTSDLMRSSLEAVASLGTARSAYIEGYRVGGKTGTAQIAENGVYISGKYILSFLGIAPMNDPQVVVYIAIIGAKNTIQYGGVVVAPLVKEVLMSSFSSLNIDTVEGGIPLNARYWIDKQTFVVEDYIGTKINRISSTPKYNIQINGTGSIVVAQIPEPGESIIEGGTVMLYTN